MAFYRAGPRRAATSRPASSTRWRASWWRRSSCSAPRSEPAGTAPGTRLRDQRPRAGLAAVVLPLEQHSGRRAARPGGRRAGSRIRAVLEQQVRADAGGPEGRRAGRATSPASGCILRELANVQTEAKDFDDNLRQSFRRETELLFGSIVREDRSLLDAARRRLHLRGRAAGAPLRHPERPRQLLPPRDAGPDSPRRGLLGHGSMLTVTSVATRTSPVSRGKWVLENLLGAPPPQPPPGVEVNLDEDPNAAKPTTLRQRLELHRANPVCASCHKIMDPMGFALENFDLVGAWRDTRRPGSDRLHRPAGRRHAAQGPRRPAEGGAGPLRGVHDRGHREAADLCAGPADCTLPTCPTVRGHRPPRRTQDDNRFSSLVLGVVESAPFRMRIKKS